MRLQSRDCMLWRFWCYIGVLLLLIHTSNAAINETGLIKWFNSTLQYAGGTTSCSSCEPGVAYMPTYACSGVRGGNWNNGIQTFIDPVEPGFLVTEVYVQFIGAFYCNTGRPNASLLVSLNKLDLSEFELPTKPTPGCFCPHCVATYASPVASSSAGWPTYNYGKNNSVLVVVQNPQVQEICLSEISVMLGAYRVIPIPNITLPNAVPIGGGTKILIVGKYFRSDIDYRCRFGEIFPDPPFATYINETKVTCMAPKAQKAGIVKLKLEPDFGTAGSTPTNNYSVDLLYFQQPTLVSVVPASAKPGQNVTITGNGFVDTGSISCLLGDVSVAAVFINATTVICTIPTIPDIEVTAIQLALSLNSVDYSPSMLPFTYLFPAEVPWASISDSPYRKWYIIGGVAAGVVFVSLIAFIVYNCRRGRKDRYMLIPDGDMEPGRELQVDISEITIRDKIGRGSFGDIYVGEWRGVEVAVKKIAYANMSEKFIQELWREAHLMKNMRHPNIIQLFGVCTEKPEIAILMEMMHKGSLYRILHDPTIQLDWPLRKAIVLDAAKGMHYLHSSNPIVMHRDFKSHNLLVDSNWRVKVSDFGLSRMIEDQLTATMTVCGTPCWTAPEVLRNQKYSVKADIYSFGIVMWEVSTRLDPYQGVAPFQVVVQVATSHLRPGIPPYCPQAWIDLMVQCWSETPENRPTFGEIVERLQAMDVSGVPTDFSLSPQPSPASTPGYGSSASSDLPPVRALSGSFLAGVSSGAASASAPSYGSIQN